jgi:hypothetical protein
MTDQHDSVLSRCRRISMLLLVLVAGTASYLVIERGQHAMNPNAFASSSGASKPQIDTLAPKKTATATFAMG